MKIKYANELVEQLVMGDPTTCVYQFIFDEKNSVDIDIIKCLLCMDWDCVSG